MSKKEHMSSDKDILKKFEPLKDNKQFSTPQGYFDSFADRLMQNIESTESDVQIKTHSFSFMKVLAVAASLAALFLLTYTSISIVSTDSTGKTLSENEIMAMLESDIYEIDENYLIDQFVISDQSITSDEINLTEEEIITYLIEEGADVDLTGNNF